MNPEEWAKIFSMCNDKHLYVKLISSLFPTIHGNEEVKRGLLLMLFGGVPKVTMEKTALRGDINICIVGDPSVAKSQFLKQVCSSSVYQFKILGFMYIIIYIYIVNQNRWQILAQEQFTLRGKHQVQQV